ncbi:MAG: translation initiation factor IF-2, partial [Thermodesulfobacteriota bacterium]
MANKIRVYELAKEAGMKSKILTTQLIELGYDVKAYNSTLDEETAEEIRERLGLKNISVERKRIEKAGRTVIRRRRMQKTAAEGGEAEMPQENHPSHDFEQEREIAEENKEEIDKPEEKDRPEGKAPEAPVVFEKKPGAVERQEPEAEKPGRAEEEKEEASVQSESPVEPRVQEKKEEAPAPAKKFRLKGRKQVAKVVGMTDIPLSKPAEDRVKPKRPAKPEKMEVQDKTVVPPREAAPAGKKKETAKKGKRYVKFDHNEGDDFDRFKKRVSRKGKIAPKAEGESLNGGERAFTSKGDRGSRKKKKKEQQIAEGAPRTETKAIKRRIKVEESITVSELAHRMGVKANEVISRLMGLGVMASLNQPLDVDTASLVASDFSYQLEQSETDEQFLLNFEESESGGTELPRPPVVTVMGHVDHGKTSILDAIRQTDVASGEAGGITQHIGANYVRSPHGDLVFLDTPGHEAFTEMRSRGAQITDVVVLVVAADDGVMDQTKEAINHARAAEVPILVVVNKIDKDNADPERIKRELAELGLLPEDWGGETIYCETSAKQGFGIEDLVENIILQTEILDLKANPNRRAKGWVVEAQLHKGRGPVATVLIKHGTLRIGDNFVVGHYYGKV